MADSHCMIGIPLKRGWRPSSPNLSRWDSRGVFGWKYIKGLSMVTLEPTESRWTTEVEKVQYRRTAKENEFDVHARLYTDLLTAGADVRGEVTVRGKEPHLGERGRWQCRFDLAVFHGGVLAHIIEVKAGPVKHKFGLEGTRQCRRYRSFGVPVTFIYGKDDADAYVRLYKHAFPK